jgi:hypothetical protein
VTVPSPGSDRALAQGCLCPVIDNGRGAGCGQLHPTSGRTLFVMSTACPLHGVAVGYEWEPEEPEEASR